MDVEATTEPGSAGTGDLIHEVKRDESTVAVGADDKVTLMEAMLEIEDSFREFALQITDKTKVSMHAQKVIFRCVDEVKRFNNEYR